MAELLSIQLATVFLPQLLSTQELRERGIMSSLHPAVPFVRSNGKQWPIGRFVIRLPE